MAIFIQKPWYKQESAHIYGVEWDGTSRTDWTRTDDAASFGAPNPYYAGMSGTPSSPFDNLLPWSGMVVEEDANAGTVVKIPKFWYKWTRENATGGYGGTMKLQIADKKTVGFAVSPAHRDRGDGTGERDYVYIGRYHCSTSDYKSTSGVKPKTQVNRETARTGIHNLGANIWQMDFSIWWTINMLYLVEFADWNSQTKIGVGCGNNSGAENSGASNAMPYHTGTKQSSRNTYGVGVQYRHIEDWWGNVLDWCDGIYFSGTNKADIYCINKPERFSDNSNGTKVGSRYTAGNNYAMNFTVSSSNSFPYAIYPRIVGGTDSTYITDYTENSTSGTTLRVGGCYEQNKKYGMFYTSGYSGTLLSQTIGCRLMILP